MTDIDRGSRANRFHALRVADVERLCSDAVAVTFDVPADLTDTYAFCAGQSLVIRKQVGGKQERRNYSICAKEGSRPRIGVREVPEGAFSTWLVNEVGQGELVDVLPPTGSFTTETSKRCQHVFIAAGSGITPILSIVSSVLARSESLATVLYGNRRADTVMFADELADLKDSYPTRLELMHVLSRESREADLFTGRIDAEKLHSLLRLLPEPEQVDHWWLCGPFEMVAGARNLLANLGVPSYRVHQELFYVDNVPPEPVRHQEKISETEITEVTVVLDGRSTTVNVPATSSILDGAQRTRPDLPFACKGGVCGTCRAKVTEGEVTMRRNFALEQSEVDDGFVLTCQSIPTSGTVTVDYDC